MILLVGKAVRNVKKNEIKIGEQYIAKISGKLVPVKIISECSFGGWNGVNTVSGRDVRIRYAAKLRRGAGATTFTVKCPKCGLVYESHYPQSAHDVGAVHHRPELCGK